MSTLSQRPRTWRHVIDTANLPDGAEMDAVSKWLIVTLGKHIDKIGPDAARGVRTLPAR